MTATFPETGTAGGGGPETDAAALAAHAGAHDRSVYRESDPRCAGRARSREGGVMARIPVQTYDHSGHLIEETFVDVPDDVVNVDVLRDRMRGAFAVNAAYLAIPTPTTVQQRVQVERLTRQTTALLRLALGELDTIDGT